MLLGTIMLLNVWGVIWRNQKIVLANAANLLNGGQADPERRRRRSQGVHGVADRTPFFSVTMLFFMVFTQPPPLHGLPTSAAARWRPTG